MKKLIDAIYAIYPLSKEALNEVSGLVRSRCFPKNAYILRLHEVCHHVWFIRSGLVRIYYLDDGVEKTTWLLKEGDFFMSPRSFYTRSASSEAIVALEETEVYSIHYDALHRLYHSFPDFSQLGRMITEKYYLLSEQRNQMMRQNSVEQRIEWLFKEYPAVLSKVSIKNLASYVGCTPETFSKVIAKK
ncbi:Crp/Fnr family transcriptional regulator [Larkinella soli]|uniref:Crp/Fnr family transcriptional regulator n=1 Tax=Larkinella soli TaxID=1770527 RepID=UPI0013E33BDA|nr:Crp/Fnr family transcriptional regulator [Larkinella soli]